MLLRTMPELYHAFRENHGFFSQPFVASKGMWNSSWPAGRELWERSFPFLGECSQVLDGEGASSRGGPPGDLRDGGPLLRIVMVRLDLAGGATHQAGLGGERLSLEGGQAKAKCFKQFTGELAYLIKG